MKAIATFALLAVSISRLSAQPVDLQITGNAPRLNTANAEFFNEMCRYRRLSSVPASFDFSGKKPAIFVAGN